MDVGLRLFHQTIKCAIKTIWPKHRPLTSKETAYICLKAIKARRLFKDSNKDYNAFKEVIGNGDLLNGIDNQCTIDDNEAYQLAQEWCEEVVKCSKDSNDSIFFVPRVTGINYREGQGFQLEVGIR